MLCLIPKSKEKVQYIRLKKFSSVGRKFSAAEQRVLKRTHPDSTAARAAYETNVPSIVLSETTWPLLQSGVTGVNIINPLMHDVRLRLVCQLSPING
jgi:hypothetical protein